MTKHIQNFDERAPLAEAEGIGVEYRGRRGKFRALDDVSLVVRERQTVSIVGESGSGKSTLGRVILGLQKPAAGRVRYRGADTSRLTFAQRSTFRRDVQVVFQDPGSSLNPRKNVLQLIGDGMLKHRVVGKKQLRPAVVELLQRVGLSGDHLYRMPHEMSGGQKQRIAIARAISTSPRLIVADEALSALDMSVQAQVLALMADLQRDLGMAYLFVSHDLNTVRAISDEVVVMNQGRIVERGGVAQIFDDPQHEYTRRLLAARLDRADFRGAVRRRSKAGRADCPASGTAGPHPPPVAGAELSE